MASILINSSTCGLSTTQGVINGSTYWAKLKLVTTPTLEQQRKCGTLVELVHITPFWTAQGFLATAKVHNGIQINSSIVKAQNTIFDVIQETSRARLLSYIPKNTVQGEESTIVNLQVTPSDTCCDAITIEFLWRSTELTNLAELEKIFRSQNPILILQQRW